MNTRREVFFNFSSAKKFASPSEGGSAGGFKGGMPSRPSVAPPPCSFESGSPSKILFFLIEKIFGGRAQIRKCKEYFARRRALASGGGAASFVGVCLVKGSDFIQEGQLICKVCVSRPARAKIIKNQRPSFAKATAGRRDFCGKKFGFCSGETAYQNKNTVKAFLFRYAAYIENSSDAFRRLRRREPLNPQNLI